MMEQPQKSKEKRKERPRQLLWKSKIKQIDFEMLFEGGERRKISEVSGKGIPYFMHRSRKRAVFGRFESGFWNDKNFFHLMSAAWEKVECKRTRKV